MAVNALVIYKSSAGSGKTYTLVLEYLKLVLQKPGLYRAILAITFTNKATEEMKSRIIGSLVEISENKNVQLQETLAGQTGIAYDELPGKASKVLDKILHDYSGFAVSTIDSFFSTMVRALARELNLPLRFDIELNMDSVISEITSMMMDEIGTSKWLKKWLEEFIFDKLDQGKSWKIEDDIHSMAFELFKESYRHIFTDKHPKPDEEFIIELRKLVTGFENQMAAYGKAFLDIIAQHHLEIADFAYGKTGVANYFSKITRKMKSDDFIPGDRVMNAFGNAELWVSKTSKRKEEIIALAAVKLIPLARETDEFRSGEMPGYSAAKMVLNTIHIAGIFSLLDEKLKLFREENELVLISDTNQLLQKAISGLDAPFIYEKTGNRFTHFMLDEFQDTSDYQWQNLMPLIQNALGSGNYAMIVGDAKQSIYRWRGGNMQLLLTGVQQQLNHFSEITQLKNLSDNYRSREKVVAFNNIFFETAPGLLLPGEVNEKLRIAYRADDLKQQWKKGKENEGYINIRFVDPNGDSGSAGKGPGLSNSSESSEDDTAERACRENLAIINEVLALGFEFRDIAFLTRSNQDAKAITAFLIENGIHRIISPESMQLNRSPKIQFIINLIQFIDEQDNDIILAQIVYYWNIIRQQETARSPHRLFSESRKNKLSLLPEAFSNKLLELRKLPLFEAIEELTIIFKLGSPPEAYLQRFFDVILDYSRRNPANITDFLKWWEENQEKDTCSVVIPSGENAIRVMSIHKSKGLQFPVVIIPFANWDLKPKSQSILWVKSNQPPFNNSLAHPVKFSGDLEHSVFADDYNKEIQLNYVDNLNVLYVAFTRAEEQLYIVSKKPSESSQKNGDKHPGKAGELILATIKAADRLSTHLDETTGLFEFGICSKPFRKPKDESLHGKNLQQWLSTSWKSRIKMGISKKKIASSDPETPETQYGILFHYLVSEVKTIVNPETFVKTHDASREADLLIQQRLTKDIGMFVEAAKANGWFNIESETLNEAELLLPDGSLLRPDRLILMGNRAIVVDYKTGVEEKYHGQQVQQYAGVLNQMGYSETKMYLVYPAINKVVDVAAG